MQVHLFGAAFGIMVALLLSRDGVPNNPKMSGSYRSTAEAFVGCLFLWVYYPSFNSCLS
jgi:ammonium transporter Rh